MVLVCSPDIMKCKRKLKKFNQTEALVQKLEFELFLI